MPPTGGRRRERARARDTDDAPRLVALYDRLSRHTPCPRFSAVVRRLPPDGAEALATVDDPRRLALVAERDTAAAP